MIIKTDPESFQSYLRDASNFQGSCDAVYFPESANEIALFLKDAQQKSLPVTIAGSHTGVTGGSVPNGGVVLSLEKLNSVCKINCKDKTLTVSPGVILADIITYAQSYGLFYPPDPTEKNCFIGGNAATNASGARSYGYGSTRDYVNELEIILPDGELLCLKRGENFAVQNELHLTCQSGKKITLPLPQFEMPKVKNAAGYFIQENMDAVDLFIGQEGTLGVITSLTLQLLPKPEKMFSAVIFFNKENDAFEFAAGLKSLSTRHIETAIHLRALEFFDEHSLTFLSEKFPRIPLPAKGAVLIEQDIHVVSTESDLLDELSIYLQKHNANEEAIWFAFDESSFREMQEFRHSISYMVNEYVAEKNYRKLGTDTVVPDEHFHGYYQYCKAMVEHAGLLYVYYGHFGNSHLHLNILPLNEQQFETGKTIYRELCIKAVALGGTVSGEHGIGKFKRDYFRLQYSSATIKAMAKIKKILDPCLILNTGNIFFDEDFENI